MMKISYSTTEHLEQIKEVLKYHEYGSINRRYYQYTENAVIYWPSGDCTKDIEKFLLDTVDGFSITTIPSCALRFNSYEDWWMLPADQGLTDTEIEFTNQFQYHYKANRSSVFIADENIETAAFLAQCTFPHVKIIWEHPKIQS